MKSKLVFVLAGLGLLAGLVAAYVFGVRKPPEPPAFTPASNPYAKGIYAEGIVESFQSTGSNINIYPEVAGTVTEILVHDGQAVHRGTPLFRLDDSVQRATVEQLQAQAEAARAVLDELKAQPRKEVLEVSLAQLDAAQANEKTARDQLAKIRASHRLNARSVSKNDLDNAINAFKAARTSSEVARKQYELTRAGAWSFDIRSQEKQYDALLKSAASASALLGKYTVSAPTDGVVYSIGFAVGSYLSPQGAYDTYTQGFAPALVMGGPQDNLQVRCYVDEILVHRLPDASQMNAQMFVRGTNLSAPLEFERVQPYVTPKIELSNQRTERVDVRVLPVIFKLHKPKELALYPGQLVDVYLSERPAVGQLPGQARGGAP
jgi:HlyD family secretion protein